MPADPWLNLFDLGRFWEFLAALVIVFLSVDKINVCKWSCYCLVFLEASDRSGEPIHRIRLLLGPPSFCGSYQDVGVTRTCRFQNHVCHFVVQVSFSVLGAAFFALLCCVVFMFCLFSFFLFFFFCWGGGAVCVCEHFAPGDVC